MFKPLQEKKEDYNAMSDMLAPKDFKRCLFGSGSETKKTASRDNFQTNLFSKTAMKGKPDAHSSLGDIFSKFSKNKSLSKGLQNANDGQFRNLENNFATYNTTGSDSMEIEAQATNYEALTPEKENKRPSVFNQEDTSNMSTPFKTYSPTKSHHYQPSPYRLNTSNPEEQTEQESISRSANKHEEVFARPLKRKHSLIQMWKKGDPMFRGKFSTGATPKIQKPEFIQPRLASLTLKRANSDIPPTFENGLSIVHSRDQNHGKNKYVNNAKKTVGTPYPSKVEPASLLANFQIRSHESDNNSSSFGVNFGNFKMSKQSSKLFDKPKTSSNHNANSFSRNLFTSEFTIDEPVADTKNEVCKNLFLIAETPRNTEHDGERFNFMNEELNMSQDFFKPQMMNESFNRDNNQDDELEEPLELRSSFRRNLFESKEACQTPFKLATRLFAEDDDVQDEDNDVPFFSTATDKDYLKYSNESVNLTYSNQSSQEFTILGSQRKMQLARRQESLPSRFKSDYDDLEIIGSGHFGTVYKCLNKIDGLHYAIKSLKYKKKGASQFTQALNEVHALASLSVMDENPFIVRYYNVWMEDDLIYLVMEYCPSNLRNIEQLHIKFSESMIRQVLRDICAGLKYLHKQNIVHLDIKPENILYSRTQKYKIADLGLSRIAECQAGEDVVEGDSRYLAPELLNSVGDDLPDLTKADIFSLGVTIYELMIGQAMPKNGSEWRAIRSGSLPKLENLKNYSNSLKSILKAMLSPNPEQRPSASDLLENSLQSELEFELKWEKLANNKLKKKIKELEGKLNIKRKNSF